MENCNYTCLLTSAFHVVRKAFSGCLFRDNDLAGRYRRKDNHRWTSADVVKMTPCPHLFQYDYLTTVELGFTYIKSLWEKKMCQWSKHRNGAEEMVEQPLAGLESTKTKRPWHFMWFFTACLNATTQWLWERSAHADTKLLRCSQLLIASKVSCKVIRQCFQRNWHYCHWGNCSTGTRGWKYNFTQWRSQCLISLSRNDIYQNGQQVLVLI